MSKLPTSRRPTTPDVFGGKIYEQVGKYARGAVLYAFEEVGGPKGLATWAKTNPGEFYTKLFPKIITRETEVHHTRGVDELMDIIDAEYEIDDALPPEDVPPTISPYVNAYSEEPVLSDEAREDFDGFDVDDMVEFYD